MGEHNRAGFGGSARGEATLAAFSPQIEADLRRYYQVDLRDLWRPGGGQSKLTYRLLTVLTDNLPGESAYKTAVRDQIPDEQLAELAKKTRDKHGAWSHEALQIAGLRDEVRLLRCEHAAVNGAKLEFEPVPRPGVASAKRRRKNPHAAAIIRAIAQEHADLHGYQLGHQGAAG